MSTRRWAELLQEPPAPAVVRPETYRPRWFRSTPYVVWRRSVRGQWQIFATSGIGVSHRKKVL